jgi:hypothetical protein
MRFRSHRPSSWSVVGPVLLLAAWCLSAAPTGAQSGGAGLRAGVSGSPDQFYFGGHVDSGPIVDRLSFRPNVEIGVGDDVTTVAGNFEFVYWFPLSGHPVSIYAGAGPAVNVYRYGERRGSHTDIDPGVNLLVGVAHRRGLFGEVKLGFLDSPEVKFGVGYTWR